MARKRSGFGGLFEKASSRAALWTGSTPALIAAVSLIVVWLATGPLFGFSDTWQLVMNTATSIITFLMLFLIQRSQNKDALALHLKLNELVAAMQGASNRLIDVEALTEKELKVLGKHYQVLASLAREEVDITRSHSVEEARSRHSAKVTGNAGA